MDLFVKVKEFIRRSPAMYNFTINVISPVSAIHKSYKILLNQLSENARVLNIGSGSRKLKGKSIVNLDLKRYSNVSLVGNAESLPFSSFSFDGVITIATLEHIRDIKKAISEIKRVLKPGGLVYAVIPFMAGYHSAPFDYRRWTMEGVKVLFSDFETMDVGVASGPTSAFLWIFQEWLAMLLSFNIRTLYQILLIILMILTFPLKLLDLFLSKYSFAKNISYTFYFFGKKGVDYDS